jgi:uncharacterized membrane protein
MKKKLPVIIGGLVLVLVLVGAIGASVVYAQKGTVPALFDLPGDGRGPHDGRGLGDAELKAAAGALNMTTDELSTALKAGKTLEQLATDAGVNYQTVQDAINAARADEIRALIKQAVTDGKMTQAKADWLLEGLDKGYLDGPGFGFGFSGHHGGSDNQAPAQQNQTPSP